MFRVDLGLVKLNHGLNLFVIMQYSLNSLEGIFAQLLSSFFVFGGNSPEIVVWRVRDLLDVDYGFWAVVSQKANSSGWDQ